MYTPAVGEIRKFELDGTAAGIFASGQLFTPGFLAFSNVPEPTSLVALACSAGIGAMRRRRA
ncbi:MAG: PEP-CTERM sorting domain-containing protein [Anaerolineae bacterium]|nr:PEP-CTERM sorting domain-containing protein [Phycisphaerae bacterium]